MAVSSRVLPARSAGALAPWRLGCWAIAILVAAPILGVVASVGDADGAVLRHLAATTLPGILANTLGLALVVAIGTGAIGIATAWLVTMCRFAGSRSMEWALLLPMAMVVVTVHQRDVT